jgi:hypothetical protein
MRKNIFHLMPLLCSFSIYAHVGINTVTPKATLEVVAKTNGSTQTEGFMIPRLTGDQIKTMTTNLQVGTESLMIYATAAPTLSNSSVVKITQPGYYYWTGTTWENIGGLTSNIYTADGTITTAQSARNVELNGKNLVFSGVGSVGIGTTNPSAKLELLRYN